MCGQVPGAYVSAPVQAAAYTQQPQMPYGQPPPQGYVPYEQPQEPYEQYPPQGYAPPMYNEESQRNEGFGVGAMMASGAVGAAMGVLGTEAVETLEEKFNSAETPEENDDDSD